MIILSESSPKLKPSPSANDIRRITESARLSGIEVYYILQNFEGITVEDGLSNVPGFSEMTLAFWVGFIPAPAHYRAVYEVLLQKNIRLINTPEQFQRAEEFDKYYPLIADLTCKSFVVETLEQAYEAAQRLDYPVFLKGTIQSLKKSGWKACVAENESELETIFFALQRHSSRTLGKVILREIIKLKHEKNTPAGFPQGREFRVFLLKNQAIGYSYYWEKDDVLAKISAEEEKIILQLAQTASQKIDVPYIAIDIGQLKSGEWIMIEAGDGQFSGICHISPIILWQKIKDFHYRSK